MAELKTRKTGASVGTFLEKVTDPKIRRDCETVMKIMKRVTGSPPRMWGSSMVGFGTYHYKYATGREGDWFVTGFSPRKANLTLYLMSGFGKHPSLMKKLGKHATGKSCLYVRNLDDIDLGVLEQLIEASVAAMQGRSRE